MEKVDIKIDDALSAQINNSTVGFLKLRDNGREADVGGSGTFVQLGKIKGILTAGHVIDNLPETGQVGLVRPTGAFQNLRLDMSHTGRETLWDKVEGHAPDLGFLKLPDHVVATIEAQGGVFYNLEKPRDVTPSSPSHRMSESRAIVGVVDEWSEEEPGTLPKTKKKIVGGLLGAVKSTREFEEDGAKLAEVGVDYAASSRVPTSYEGVSGGALWKLHIELDGDKVVGMQKKLDGVAFRQSPDNSLVTCNGSPSIATLVERIRKKWPAVP
jgi:hypothetical protein